MSPVRAFLLVEQQALRAYRWWSSYPPYLERPERRAPGLRACLPYRAVFEPLDVSASFNADLRAIFQQRYERPLGDHCRANLLGWNLRPGVVLESVTIEALSQEVVIGLMGLCLVRHAGE